MRIEAARGEFEPAQLVVRTSKPGASIGAVRVGDLRSGEHTIPRSAVTFLEVATARITSPSDASGGLGGGGTFHERVPGRFGGFEVGSEKYEELLGDYLGQIREHLAAKGWLSKAYVYWFDEPDPKDYPFVVDVMQRLRRHAPGLARMLTEQPEPALLGHVDIWCGLTPEWTRESVGARRKAGEEVWWYVCTGPKAPYIGLFTEHPALEMRLWAWQSWQYQVEGLLVWQTNYWTSDTAFPDGLQDPWKDPMSYTSGYGTPSGNKINGTQTAIDAKRGGKIAYGPFVHTFNAILDPAEHFEKHPEYFSEIQGKRTADHTQLCLTNPKVLKIAIEKVRAWMRSSPDATIFSVSQNDWYNFCTCKACSAVMAEEGSPMGPYLRFVNAIAEAVRGEFPDKAVDTLAYQFTRKPPLHAKPLPDVIVRLSSIECCFTHPLVARREVDAANADFARDLEAWGRLSRRLYIWDYVIDYAHSIMPFPNLYSIQPNIRFFVENGVRGIYEEANYFSRGGELAELRTWIMAKTLWNPDYDTDRAIDEFLDGYYEEAAFPLRRYLDLLHGKAKMDMIHLHIFDGPGSPLFSEDVLARAEALFDEAEAAVATKPEALHRVRTARLPVTYVRIAHLIPRLDAPNGKTVEGLARLRGLFESFDATARKERVTMVSEGRGYENWAESVKAAMARTAAGIPAPEGAAVQLYIWTQEYARTSKRMEDHFAEVLDATKRAGFDDIQGWLSSYATDESAARFGALLRERGMTQRSAYSGGAMHTDEGAKAAIESIVTAAGRGVAHGLQVVVMNPDVVGREKTDEELAVQARNLDRLGEGLRALGIRLAIHTHDPEMRSEAREWYHILRNTDPEKVFFCLDLHWVYRGKQDPYRLLQDAGKRVIDLHLRNSRDGVWSEDLSDGDIDHARVREILEAMGYRGLCTVELAQEGATKTTRPLEENLKRSRDYLRRVLGR